jgi:hypothetical protein
MWRLSLAACAPLAAGRARWLALVHGRYRSEPGASLVLAVVCTEAGGSFAGRAVTRLGDILLEANRFDKSRRSC